MSDSVTGVERSSRDPFVAHLRFPPLPPTHSASGHAVGGASSQPGSSQGDRALSLWRHFARAWPAGRVEIGRPSRAKAKYVVSIKCNSTSSRKVNLKKGSVPFFNSPSWRKVNYILLTHHIFCFTYLEG